MEIFESAFWITAGFAPALAAMEASWRLANKKKKRHEKIAVEKVA
ncbi:hypothetical protein [Nitrososphaera sp.]